MKKMQQVYLIELMIVVAIIGILAAVAIRLTRITVRAKVTEGLTLASSAKSLLPKTPYLREQTLVRAGLSRLQALTL